MLRWLAAMLGAVWLAACSTPSGEGGEKGPFGSERSSEARTSRQPGLSKEAQRALAKRGIKPHDTSPISVTSQCSHKDEIGTVTKLSLRVEDGDVEDFSADVTMKGHGRCRFNLADFRQESRSPNVILRHAREKRCTVRMWREQTEKVTIAFTDCQKSCEGRAFDYLWPILVESKTGQCS